MIDDVQSDDDLIRLAGLLGAIGTFQDAAADFATERVFWITLAATGRELDVTAPELIEPIRRYIEEVPARAARIERGPPFTMAEMDDLACWLGETIPTLTRAAARLRAAREAATKGSA